MRTLIVGGGKVGSYLARELAADHHVVTVIEANPAQARKVISDVKVMVFEGDGTDIELLRAADAHRSDWVLAVTGEDENNLVAAQLAQTLGAKRVLARLNNPANKPTFDALALQYVAVTDLMVGVIRQEVSVSDLTRIGLFAKGKVEVLELEIPASFESRTVGEVNLPDDALVVTLVRHEEVQVARGETALRPGDRIIVAAGLDSAPAVYSAFGMDSHG